MSIIDDKKSVVLSCIKSEDYIPVKRNELAFLMQVSKEDMELFNTVIDELKKEGSIIETKKGKLMTPEDAGIYPGTFIGNARGFGFVKTDADMEKDIFIPPDRVNGAMNKDRVMVKITSAAFKNMRPEGEIITILERGSDSIVGIFQAGKGYGFVIPDDKKLPDDIFIPKNAAKGAVTGHKVVVKITKRTEKGNKPEGVVTEILGHVNDPGVDILSVIRKYDLPVEFPEEVYKYIENIEMTVPADEISRRRDLRDVLTITIDGDDAKDLDDAVSAERLENGNYRLGVHIADVSHYVKEGSPLDEEALKRGASVYLADRVIPMLPHKLSNGICSLNPNEDRLTLSCIMEIDCKGDVASYDICESVINSDYRMTYTNVNKIVGDKDEKLIEEYRPIMEMLGVMDELCRILIKKREKRGSVNFDTRESKIILNEQGKVIDVRPYERIYSMRIIEEFMLICNETIAENCFWQEIPFIYRNHESPDDEKIKKLNMFLAKLGYRIKGKGELHPKAIAQLLNKANGTLEEHIISRIVLRSMKQAKYMAENMGHFGLAAKYYCHFTSPIRRYPDLEIHRIIKMGLNGKLTGKTEQRLNKAVPDIAKLCSMRERTADEAERDTDKLKMAQFMEDKIGCIYNGVISGITGWGIYVELENTIEGMVPVAELRDDYYIYDEDSLTLTGENTKKQYRLGDGVMVEVHKVDRNEGVIDFLMAGKE